VKILVLSDLHLEVSAYEPAGADADVVVLAGDIHLGTLALPWIARCFVDRPVLYVSGNHEFCRREHGRVLRDLRAAAAALPGLHVFDREAVEIGNVESLGTTLSTDFTLYGEEACQVRVALADAPAGMSDFRPGFVVDL
jgi:predicted phosphodiesterase